MPRFITTGSTKTSSSTPKGIATKVPKVRGKTTDAEASRLASGSSLTFTKRSTHIIMGMLAAGAKKKFSAGSITKGPPNPANPLMNPAIAAIGTSAR